MAAVIINDDIRKLIGGVKKLAELNVVSLKEIKRRGLEYTPIRREGFSGELNNDFTILIPQVTMVIYTHEELSKGVICRHMSVSTKIAGRVPNIPAVEMLMEEFGFVNKKVERVFVDTEEFGNNQIAINVIEPLSGNMNDLRRKK